MFRILFFYTLIIGCSNREIDKNSVCFISDVCSIYPLNEDDFINDSGILYTELITSNPAFLNEANYPDIIEHDSLNKYCLNIFFNKKSIELKMNNNYRVANDNTLNIYNENKYNNNIIDTFLEIHHSNDTIVNASLVYDFYNDETIEKMEFDLIKDFCSVNEYGSCIVNSVSIGEAKNKKYTPYQKIDKNLDDLRFDDFRYFNNLSISEKIPIKIVLLKSNNYLVFFESANCYEPRNGNLGVTESTYMSVIKITRKVGSSITTSKVLDLNTFVNAH